MSHNPESGTLFEFRDANNALVALERYFDLGRQFDEMDSEGWSGVTTAQLDEAREAAVRALAKLGERDD